MVLYHYRDEWHVASSGSPDASGQVNNDSTTIFHELFWQTWKELGYKLPDETSHCYMFELMTPQNRVIIPHMSNRLVIHGERAINHLCKDGIFHVEHNPAFSAALNGWEIVKGHSIGNLDDALAASAAMNPMKQEGFVVVDEVADSEHFNRIKIKSPQYVALAHMKDGFSDRRMIDLVRTNEGSEFLGYFPEYAGLYEKYHAKFEILAKELEEIYDRIKNILSQKDFALEAVKARMSAPLFSLRNKKIPIRKSLADMNVQSLEEIFKKM